MREKEMHMRARTACQQCRTSFHPFIQTNVLVYQKKARILINEIKTNETTPPTHLIPTDRTDVAINLGGNVDQFHRPSQVGHAWKAQPTDVGDGTLQTPYALILQRFSVSNKKQCFEVGHDEMQWYFNTGTSLW